MPRYMRTQSIETILYDGTNNAEVADFLRKHLPAHYFDDLDLSKIYDLNYVFSEIVGEGNLAVGDEMYYCPDKKRIQLISKEGIDEGHFQGRGWKKDEQN